MDVFLPEQAEICVRVDQRVVAGETVIAKLEGLRAR
jgi:hypothetical protein